MGRSRTFDEADVLEAATDQFWETGFAGTSVDDVLRAAGLGKGSLYAAFGDKRLLFARVFDGYCQRMTKAVQRRLAGPDHTAARRLRSLVKGAARAGGSTEAKRACLLAKTTSELAARDEDIAARARLAFEELATTLQSALSQARNAGDVPADLDVAKGAHLLLATLRGIEALGEAGVAPAILRDAAEGALAAVALS
jgi:TetR/AcrR family transcriptional repressor of nem operon